VLLHLALCHTIVIDDRTGKFNASSPDELALVNAAKFFGAEFKNRDEDNNMVITFQGKEYKYRLLNILEFTSARKRMSVIVEDAQGNYLLFCKGADSIIEKRLNFNTSVHLAETKKHVDFFAEEGLRTLFLAKKRLTRSQYIQWNTLFEEAL
jgi:phospholipid-transporting ATPase